MKKIIVIIICFVIIAFVSCKQTRCYANKPSKGYNSFIEKFPKQSGVFDVRDKWDLSIDKITVKCSGTSLLGRSWKKRQSRDAL